MDGSGNSSCWRKTFPILVSQKWNWICCATETEAKPYFHQMNSVITRLWDFKFIGNALENGYAHGRMLSSWGYNIAYEKPLSICFFATEVLGKNPINCENAINFSIIYWTLNGFVVIIEWNLYRKSVLIQNKIICTMWFWRFQRKLMFFYVKSNEITGLYFSSHPARSENWIIYVGQSRKCNEHDAKRCKMMFRERVANDMAKGIVFDVYRLNHVNWFRVQNAQKKRFISENKNIIFAIHRQQTEDD